MSPRCDGGTFSNQPLLEEFMPVPNLLRVTAEPLEDALLVRAAGEIDVSTIPALRTELEDARQNAVTVLLDLSEITFIDSSGLHLLLDLSQVSSESDWAFFIVRPSKVVRRLIEVSGTADLLMLVGSTRERILA
jgi:anti-anti-sigma factor